MQLDMFGKPRYKVNLHTHTTLSDGRLTPAEAVQLYQSNGYDAIALTDHWFYGEGEESNDFTILSGIEYDVGGRDSLVGVYHLVGVGTRHAPKATTSMSAQEIIDAVHAAGGVSILAHPAWSLNTPEQILKLKNIDGTEIYNSASGVHNSRRPDSSVIIDMVATRGCILPLVAVDDTHYYDNDHCRSYIMVEAADNTRDALLAAIRRGKFYATQGPEIHLLREGDDFVVRCSPAVDIVFQSNSVWGRRAFTGENMTEARYTPMEHETFIRAQVTDAEGRHAWSNIIPVK